MEQGEQAASQWECAICFEALRIEQSVVTSCGHLYCWPCLHQWMETFRDKTSPPVCPVCKNVLSRDRIIPIFGRGAAGAADDDPRVRVEVPRPVPQREEAPNVPRGGHFGPAPLFPGGGFNFSVFGFPGVMAFGGNFGNFAGAAPLPEMTPEQRRQQQFLSQIMLFIGIAVLSAIFFA